MTYQPLGIFSAEWNNDKSAYSELEISGNEAVGLNKGLYSGITYKYWIKAVNLSNI